MKEAYFSTFMDIAINDFANDKVENATWPKERALELAIEACNTLLPEGLQTKNHFLLNILLEENIAGFLWFAMEKDDLHTYAFLYQIYIYPDLRSKGIGEKAMEAFKIEAKAMKAETIWLHVFGHNKKAMKFYDRIGYDISDFTLRLKL